MVERYGLTDSEWTELHEWFEIGDKVGLARRVAAFLKRVRAEAWDEGAEFMDSDSFWHDNGRGYNPYADGLPDADQD